MASIESALQRACKNAKILQYQNITIFLKGELNTKPGKTLTCTCMFVAFSVFAHLPHTFITTKLWNWIIAFPCSYLKTSVARHVTHTPFCPFCPIAMHCLFIKIYETQMQMRLNKKSNHWTLESQTYCSYLVTTPILFGQKFYLVKSIFWGKYFSIKKIFQ